MMLLARCECGFIEFFEFAKEEVEANEFLPYDLPVLLMLFTRSLYLPSFVADPILEIFPEFFMLVAEDRLLLDSLLLRFICAADLCTRWFFEDVDENFGEIMGNVKSDGKRVDVDEP